MEKQRNYSNIQILNILNVKAFLGLALLNFLVSLAISKL
jgi:hypothetical protein